MSKQLFPGFLALLWLAAVISGNIYLANYHNKAGPRIEELVLEWPSTELELDQEIPTVVVAIHPQCPCSTATAAELNRILCRYGKAVRLYVLVYYPSQMSADPSWDQSMTMNAFRIIPSAAFIKDLDGSIALKFHMLTSGHSRVYSPENKLLFCGGITLSRAHEGDNIASAGMLSALRKQANTLEKHVVFGCRLGNEMKASEE